MVKHIECRVVDSAPDIAPGEPWPWSDDKSTTELNEVSCSSCGSLVVASSIPKRPEPCLYERSHRLEFGLVVDCYV